MCGNSLCGVQRGESSSRNKAGAGSAGRLPGAAIMARGVKLRGIARYRNHRLLLYSEPSRDTVSPPITSSAFASRIVPMPVSVMKSSNSTTDEEEITRPKARASSAATRPSPALPVTGGRHALRNTARAGRYKMKKTEASASQRCRCGRAGARSAIGGYKIKQSQVNVFYERGAGIKLEIRRTTCRKKLKI